MVESIKATVIRENQAIRLRARKEFQDRAGVRRVTGEEWLVSKVGAYLPAAHEEVVDIVNAFVLTDKVSAPPPMSSKSFSELIRDLQRTSSSLTGT